MEDISGIAEEVYHSGTIEAIKTLPLEAVLLKKLIAEVEGILKKTKDSPGYEMYFLRVVTPKNYPILAYGNVMIGMVYLNTNEVWKVGMTGNGEDGRYPNAVYINNKGLNIKLDANDLFYEMMYMGTYKEVLIMEKIYIYTYSLWSGHPTLLKPPGCKIFR